MFSALSGDIPLIGRNVLLSKVRDSLQREDAYGALVYGDTGTGKSVLARHLILELNGEYVPFLINPVPALGSIPYGALAPFLGNATTADMSSPLSVLRATLAFLRKASGGRPLVVVLDDTHVLDDDSSHLLAQLVTSRTIRLIAFSRSTSFRSEELVSLCRDGLLERFDLGALDHTESRRLCSLVLGGDIVRGSSDRLCDEASGNPLFLKAILDEALARGSLAKRDGVWALSDQELSLPVPLVDLVRVAIKHLDGNQRKAFEVVALADRVPFIDLVRISGEDAVATLLQEGLIRDDPEDAAFAIAQYPIYGRAVRMLIPVGRSTALHHELIKVQGHSRGTVRAQIRSGIWMLDCGERIEDDRLIILADQALRLLDPASALRFIGSIRNDRLARTTDVLRATALFDLSRIQESRELAAGLLDKAASVDEITAVGVLDVRLRIASGEDIAGLPPVFDRWESALGRVSDEEAGVRAGEQRLLTARALGWNLEGRFDQTVGVLRELLQQGSSDPRVLVLSHVLLAEALGALGRGTEARQHSENALAAIETDPDGLLDLHRVVLLRHITLVVHSGDFEAAERELRAYAPGRGRDYDFISGSLAVLDAACDIRRGRFRAGTATLRPALAALRLSDKDGLLPYALGIAAWAAAASGEAVLASESLAELANLRPRGGWQFLLLAEAFATAAKGLIGAEADAEVQLLHQAETARTRRWTTCEKDILELATSLGGSAAAELLRNVTESVEGTEAAVLNAYARALLARDPGALAAAGDRAELLQKHLLAVEACHQAMEVYAGVGDAQSHRALAPVIRRRRALIDGGVLVEATEMDAVTPLTPREREIATLALQGLSNREIARSLTVSTRTVEGHLYRIYVKLGISRREDLTSELEALLGP